MLWARDVETDVFHEKNSASVDQAFVGYLILWAWSDAGLQWAIDTELAVLFLWAREVEIDVFHEVNSALVDYPSVGYLIPETDYLGRPSAPQQLETEKVKMADFHG